VDVAVIGAGIGGLSAAAHLARRGFTVAVFDSHYVAGGCATQFARGPARARYCFDIGVHYLGDCGPGGAIPTRLAELGIELEYNELDPDGYDVLCFPDFRFKTPADPGLYRERMLDLFPEERRGIDRWMAFLRDVDRAADILLPQDGILTPLAALKIAFRAPRTAWHRRRTLESLMDTYTSNPRLKALWSAQYGDYALPPYKASAVYHGTVATHFLKGAWYPKGGGQVIADRLAEAVEDAGGSIHLKRRVESVLIEGGRATGVRLAGRRGPPQDVRAFVVVSGADLQRTMLDLVGPEHLPPRDVARARGWEMPGGIFITCLGVTADLRAAGMTSGNYWVLDDYDFDTTYADALERGVVRPGGCMITSGSLKDPGFAHAPEGVKTVEVMTLVHPSADKWGVSDAEALTWGYRHNARYEELKADIEQQMVDRLDALFPGTKDTIVFRESATPVTHMRYTRAAVGTGYGIAGTPAQYMDRRPGPRTSIPGLYVCGGSTRGTAGILGCMVSGRDATMRILEDRAASRRVKNPSVGSTSAS